MSHTNQTPNYHLPQFIGTDKPAWLVDFNQAMSDIDTQMKANETASATAEANAQSALSGLTATNAQVGGLQTDVSAIQTQLPLDEAQIATNTQNISTQASAIVSANNRIDTANGNITALNTKVGDLTDLDTTDKTSVVNAVNELNADITQNYIVNTAKDVSQATAQAPWICESDGYIKVLNNNSSADVTIHIDGDNFGITHYFSTDRPYESIALFVKKGCRLYVTGNQAFNGYAQFHAVTPRQ